LVFCLCTSPGNFFYPSWLQILFQCWHLPNQYCQCGSLVCVSRTYSKYVQQPKNTPILFSLPSAFLSQLPPLSEESHRYLSAYPTLIVMSLPLRPAFSFFEKFPLLCVCTKIILFICTVKHISFKDLECPTNIYLYF
jgi:hypothetical protein